MTILKTEPLTAAVFSRFGDVLEAAGDFRLINAGRCQRHHDRAKIDAGPDARPGISIFRAEPRALPYEFSLVERHPEGSQAFLSMSEHPFLVIVAPDVSGRPGQPRAFLTNGAQGINLHRGIWHGVLTPLAAPGLFAVVDRIGDTANLEEFTYPQAYLVSL